jgi:hypothetical protein
MATMSAGGECTGPTRSGSTPSDGGCARPTPGREATSPDASTAEVCSATADVPTATAEVCSATADVPTATAEVCSATADVPTGTAEVPTGTAEVPTATALTAAMVLRGSIGSKR